MEDPRMPRYRAAAKASLGVLAVLLVCQSASPITGIREKRRTAALGDSPATADAERRLRWWGGGVGEKQKEAAHQGKDKTNLAGRVFELQPGGAAGVQKKRLRPSGQRVPNVPVSDTVDLTTGEEGLLWLPMSMTPLQCSGADDEGSFCESTVRFCLMNIADYQQTPWKFPMTAMLQKKSLCNKEGNMRAFHLSTLRAYMREHPDEFLEPNGFVYHETRTGSTLVANMLAHVPSNLVLSENNVAEDPARHCHNCTDAQKVSVLRDTMRLLGNARNGHKHVFFKFQDSTTLKLMMQAFPSVGWVYLFRDPVEVMVSNLKGAYGKRERFYEGFDFDAADNTTAIHHELSKPNAKPAKPLMSPCLMSGATAEMKGRPREEICAARLKTLCQAAVDQLELELQRDGRGAVVEYTNLPDVVTEYIYPVLFGMGNDKLEEHLPYLSEAARMYSKSMSNPETEFAPGTDAGYKHVMAEKAYKDAAESTGLTAVYTRLQGLQSWHKEPHQDGEEEAAVGGAADVTQEGGERERK